MLNKLTKNKKVLVFGGLALLLGIFALIFSKRTTLPGTTIPSYLIETKEDDAIPVTTLQDRAIIKIFDGRPVNYQRFVSFDSPNQDTLLYVNPRFRILEVSNGTITEVLLSDTLKNVNEISWFDDSKAVITTGNTLTEKTDYLLDFTDWSSTTPPGAIALPNAGENYAWNFDGSQVAYFGSIDPARGTTNLFVYDLTNGTNSRIGNLIFSGPVELLWLFDGTFVSLEFIEADKELLYLSHASRDASGTWVTNNIALDVASVPVLSMDKTRIAYVEETILVVHDFVSNSKILSKSIAEYGNFYAHTFYNSDLLAGLFLQDGALYEIAFNLESNAVTKSKIMEVGNLSGDISNFNMDDSGLKSFNISSDRVIVFN